jgi:hypothetical protein
MRDLTWYAPYRAAGSSTQDSKIPANEAFGEWRTICFVSRRMAYVKAEEI